MWADFVCYIHEVDQFLRALGESDWLRVQSEDEDSESR